MGFARLVYSPKAFVYVKDGNNQIHDLSAYTTAGRVSRKINQISTAEVTLRNPDMIFTDRRRGATFTPQDPITIYLQRLRNRPVRVFTGFLDKTPWLHLYPGTVTLRASCTLKKLMYTFFDPALPYVNGFLQQYGWLNKNDGTAINPEVASQVYDPTSNNPKIPSADGSIGNLLFATLSQIGNWDPNTIFIQNLPSGLPDRMAALAREFNEDNKKAREQFEALMHTIIGSGSYGDGGGAGTSIDLGDSRVPETVYLAGKQMHVSQKFLLAAMMTGLVECPQESTFGNCGGGDQDSQGWRQERTSLYADPRNVPASARRFFAECKQFDRGQSAGELAADVQRPRADLRGRYEEERSRAEALLKKLDDQYANKGLSEKDAATNDLTNTVIKKAGDVSGKLDNLGHSKLVSPVKGMNVAGIGQGGGAYGAPRPYGKHAGVDCPSTLGAAWYSITDGTVTAVSNSWTEGTGCVVIKPDDQIKNYPKTVYLGYGGTQSISVKVGDKVSAGQQIAVGGSHGSGPHLHFFVRTSNGVAANGEIDPTPLAKAAAKGTQPSGGPGTDNATSTDSKSSSDQMYSIAQASAFAAQLDWPSLEDTIEAVGLQGQKSLMNDKPLMPFIQQLTEAGLRQFQSMPNGSFYAFYPDYFGEFGRKPYWMISDVEILDGGIDLNDEALATHVYVVGDTIPNGSIDMNDRLFSGGVVSIFNAFMAGDTLIDRPAGAQSKKKASERFTQLIDKSDAIKFLQRYGARPQLFEEPMIRSPYFEAFLAYQKFMLLWSRQFLTTFTFTFMPELFPGGKVGFDEHGLECYIDEVEHTWDYESGFFTQANLSAPSVLSDATDGDLPPNMVVQQALYEPIAQTTQVKSPHGGTFPVMPSPQ